MRSSLESVRDEARTWYEQNWDPDRSVGEWYSLMAASGWGYPGWPAEWFGRGLDKDAVGVVRQQRKELGALPPPSGIGPTLLAPMLFEHGNDEQRQRFLSGMAKGEIIVCQMLSEPSAGSDLAGVRTRAERDGEEWRITGQKVWTSNAAIVDYGMLLARTNVDVAKHRGLSFFLVRRDQPGIEVRPLREMTGAALFNEVFFEGAIVPDADVLGEIDHGWAVTRTFLAHEKNSLNPAAHEGGIFGRVDLDRPVGEIMESRRSTRSAMGRGATRMLGRLWDTFDGTTDPVLRQEMMRLRSGQETLKATNLRVRAAKAQGGRPGREASISKLIVSDTTRAQRELGLRLQGPYGMLADDPFSDFVLGSPAISIAGGTDEIQKNHLGERILGLPAEPRTDTEIPFRDHP